MKDIILPSESSDAIDLGAINENTTGIIIAYKGNDAVGYIHHIEGNNDPWEFINGIDIDYIALDINGNGYAATTLTTLVSTLIKDNIADNFKLINFVVTLDNYNPDKLSLD